MPTRISPQLLLLALGMTTAACVGVFGDGDSKPSNGAGNAAAPAGAVPAGMNPDVVGVGTSGARRLTRTEYDATLRDLIGDTSGSGQTKLPEETGDGFDPFDNNYLTQQASGTLIEHLETIAAEAVDRIEAAKWPAILGCAPSGPNDAACMKQFVASFGRRVLRRPLAEDELAEYAALLSFSQQTNDFLTGAKMVVRALLQDPEFVYRIELGRPVPNRPGLYQLTPFEVATRLSYFLTGSTPDDSLLDQAAADRLRTRDELRAAAARLVDSPAGRTQVARFHALWLSYTRLPQPPELATAMQRETRALLERVIFQDKGSWLDIFRAKDTFVDATLAEHYGLAAPAGGPAWVPYAATGRQGILSHGTFLSVASKFGDTSPTKRGLLIRNRLFCQRVPPPPPTVNVDIPPPPTATSRCKFDRFAAHRTPACAGCHSQMDPIGFGLENFDDSGRFRRTDNDASECTIAGDGELVGIGTFHGPAGLSDLLVSSGSVESCIVKQVFRFAQGRLETDLDGPMLDALSAGFKQAGNRFDTLLLDVVSAEAFGYRRDE